MNKRAAPVKGGKGPPGRLKVLMVSPEATPFVKTGGLGDVAGALPGALKALGLDVRLAIPFYREVRERHKATRTAIEDLEVPLGGYSLVGSVLEARTEQDVPVYFIEREDLYDRPNVYGNERGDYYDNLERFVFFARAVLRLAESLPFHPDIIHCHDWQSGLVPALLRGPYQGSTAFRKTATVFTIHNIGYQGVFPPAKLDVAGLSRKEFFRMEGLEYWGNISLLKAGVVYSDVVTTVSPTYAKEIQNPEFGMGMEGALAFRRSTLYGILNGVDYGIWDPADDPHLPARYSLKDFRGKQTCKMSLLKETGLDPSLADRPLFGVISRLDLQKGLDLLVQALEEILKHDVGFAILGTGDPKIQRSLTQAAEGKPGRVAVRIGFDESLAHRIMAGSDGLLIPSRYEPCGLTQMYALKYGTVPVVRATGGLEDTIRPFDARTGKGNGFKFRPYEPKALQAAILEAITCFKDRVTWQKIVKNGMRQDFSWERSARRYAELYGRVVESSRPGGGLTSNR